MSADRLDTMMNCIAEGGVLMLRKTTDVSAMQMKTVLAWHGKI